jgi:hypothetical protein
MRAIAKGTRVIQLATGLSFAAESISLPPGGFKIRKVKVTGPLKIL